MKPEPTDSAYTQTLFVISVLIATIPAAAQEPSSKPIFIGQWRSTVDCGPIPAAAEITAADNKHIVVNGHDYKVSGLPGYPPRDRENQVIAGNLNFQIFNEEKSEMIISKKGPNGIGAQCHYSRKTK